MVTSPDNGPSRIELEVQSSELVSMRRDMVRLKAEANELIPMPPDAHYNGAMYSTTSSMSLIHMSRDVRDAIRMAATTKGELESNEMMKAREFLEGQMGDSYDKRLTTQEIGMLKGTPNPAVQIKAPASADLSQVTELTSAIVENYGVDAMERSAKMSDKLLAMSGAETGGAFSDKMLELTALAKGLDPQEAVKRRSWWFKMLKRMGLAKSKIDTQFKALDVQITTLSGELQRHSDRQRDRANDLEALFDENTRAYQEIEKLVIAGRAFLKRPRSPITEAVGPMDAQKHVDQYALEQRLDKRLNDLDIAMTLMVQTAPEIRIMQANGRALVDKFTTLTKLTIPAWKKQFALHVMQLEQKKTASVSDAAEDATDDAIRQNADMLRETTSQIAAAGQRPMVRIGTIEHVQQQLLATVDDVRQITAEAARERVGLTKRLVVIRDDLVTGLQKRPMLGSDGHVLIEGTSVIPEMVGNYKIPNEPLNTKGES